MKKRRIDCLFLCLLLLVAAVPLFSLPSHAARQYVFDQANLLTADEIGKLEKQAAGAKEAFGMDLAVVTANDVQGKSTRAYADDFFDALGFQNGALLLIDMENREVYISTAGTMIGVLTDKRIDRALDEVAPPLSDGAYYASADAFYRYSVKCLGAYPPAGGPNLFARLSLIPGRHLLIFAIIALAAGAILFGLVAFRYRRNPAAGYYPYDEMGTVHMKRSEDTFVNRFVTKRVIQTDHDSDKPSGGSSTHTSSSGTTHGGGGRSF